LGRFKGDGEGEMKLLIFVEKWSKEGEYRLLARATLEAEIGSVEEIEGIACDLRLIGWQVGKEWPEIRGRRRRGGWHEGGNEFIEGMLSHV